MQAAQLLDLARAEATTANPSNLHLIHAGPTGSQLRLPAGWLSVWSAWRGRVALQSPRGRWSLRGGELLLADEGPLDACSDAPSAYLVLAAPNRAWRNLLESIALEPAAETGELLVGQGACPRNVQRGLVHMARGLGRGAAETSLAPLLRALLDEQRELRALAARCNGRTARRRLATLQRLQRVRQLIERSEDPLDLAALARNASYSPWHLMRMYREVFGETPSGHQARLRLARAWALVRDSRLTVCEITERLGFESQSAFCRAFKSAYGLTTTQVRHLPTTAAHARPSRARLHRRWSQTA
ncbi:helix-turn-helix transcriptional regulator [Lysobacter solisilvae (ex Woo and Kim 2020)]|uniref:Helix-turn-helix transcriptional regulator n=1 Tax=Agrilutibacter terrestris TaxID=2865112 RepID=A0A7H0FV06_9GAMM|nr:AraC family transcriptional regulator [Lysobacter terrestris]QNP39872.1 helix-turn-helix transcriptional regulator [Lysobacter terrestris]